jgi:hypothetical protein
MSDTRFRDLATFSVDSQPIRNFPLWKSLLGDGATLVRYEPELDRNKVPTVSKRRWEDEATNQGLLFVNEATLDDNNVLLEEARQPNRIGWMIPKADEPDSSNHMIPAEKLLAAVNTIIDVAGTDKPILINFAGDVVTRIGNIPRNTAYYSKIFGNSKVQFIGSSDWYPNNRDFNRYPEWFSLWAADRLLEWGATTACQILECSDQGIVANKGRGPTTDEFYFQFWNCFAHGHKPCLFPQKIGNARDVQDANGKYPSLFQYDFTTPEMKDMIKRCAVQYNQLWPFMRASNHFNRRCIIPDPAFIKTYSNSPYEGELVATDWINDKVNLMTSFRLNWSRTQSLGLGNNTLRPLQVQIMQTAIGSHPSLLGGKLKVSIEAPGWVSNTQGDLSFTLQPE